MKYFCAHYRINGKIKLGEIMAKILSFVEKEARDVPIQINEF